MRPNDRQARVAALVGQEGQLTVEALAATFDVSIETIRRDLAALAEAGLVLKVHGGARALPRRDEGSFDDRMAEDALAKEAIGRTLAGLVAPGETLFLDTGTTTLACAQALRAVAGVTVVTNSARIARAFARPAGPGASDPGGRALLLGGAYRFDNDQTLGPDAIRAVAGFRADRAILGAAAVEPGGAMDADLDEAQVARAMQDHARETVVVAAAAKFARHAPHRVTAWTGVAALVSDAAPEGDLARALAQGGVRVEVAA